MIGVCGGGAADGDDCAAAEEVGRGIADAGAVLVTGGSTGVMEAASRGAARAGGLVLGVLRGADPGEANAYCTISLPTGMGEARNFLIVRFAEAVIAVGGEWGTLSEIAFARKIGRPVVLLRPGRFESLALETARDAGDAVERAIRHATAARASQFRTH